MLREKPIQFCCLTVAPTCGLVGKCLVWAWAVGQLEQKSGRRAGINWNLPMSWPFGVFALLKCKIKVFGSNYMVLDNLKNYLTQELCL